MDRFQAISITNLSLGAHLYPSEEVFLLTGNVGLYSGPNKSLQHTGGTVYLTTHRLFYIDDTNSHSQSCFLTLDLVRETQYYAGFFKSSPKVTLGFEKRSEASDRGEERVSASIANNRKSKLIGEDRKENTAIPDHERGHTLAIKTWICRICAYSNTLESSSPSSSNSTVKCQLCGVASESKDLVMEETKTASKLNCSAQRDNQAQASTTSKNGLSCPICTFANHPSMSRCEMCDTPLGTINPKELKLSTIATTRSEEISESRRHTPVPKEEALERHDSVRLSFRKGGDKEFYSLLKTILKEKHWQKSNLISLQTLGPSSQSRFSSQHRNIDGRSASSALVYGQQDGETGTVKRVGIEGIFSAVDLQAQEESDDMKDAFRDLEALMKKAKKMVDLAELLNAKLTRQEASADAAGRETGGKDETANIIRSSLVRLGLSTPAITLDMAKDEMEYNLQLAQELAGLLYSGASPLMGKGRVLAKQSQELLSSTVTKQQPQQLNGETGKGIIPLDELWCMWNRARGVALVSPKTLLAVCKILPTITAPCIDCKTFQSGIRVLHTSKYQASRFSVRMLSFLAEKEKLITHDHVGGGGRKEGEEGDGGGLNSDHPMSWSVGATTLEIANQENCPLYLANEILSEIEFELGTVVRDDHGQDLWYENKISHFDWDRWVDSRGTYS
ncbi:hypothetical protein CBS101457_001442 [Exobasidium rhododendri]|nr:hypothetical protein CBS101457_001442 [Exobasidium rhododendri]